MSKQKNNKSLEKQTSNTAQGTDKKFEAVNVESLFPVLDAISWLDMPTIKQIAQFAGIDPRTAGKLVKNASHIDIVGTLQNESYRLKFPYPYKGSINQKNTVVKEAILRMPLIISMKQFISLGDPASDALRKAATVRGVMSFDSSDYAPLLKWARQLGVFDEKSSVEDLIDDALLSKEDRQQKDPKRKVVFLSHSSKDKGFIRQLASDLEKNNITVWLDEHQIAVGDSIPEKINQGLAESDYFLIALSHNSVSSPWVTKELNSALIKELEQKKTVILPVKIDDCKTPDLIKDKRYADFSNSYRNGLNDLIAAMTK